MPLVFEVSIRFVQQSLLTFMNRQGKSESLTLRRVGQ